MSRVRIPSPAPFPQWHNRHRVSCILQFIYLAAVWPARKQRCNWYARAYPCVFSRCGRGARRRAQDRPAGRTGVQQFAEDRAGELRSVAAQAGTAAAGLPAAAMRPRRRAFPGGHALTVDRDTFSPRGHARHRGRPAASNLRREEVTRDRRGRHRRSSPPVRSPATRWPPRSRAHRLRPPVLLRRHQPHRGGRFDRHVDRLPRLALRQVARRHRTIT